MVPAFSDVLQSILGDSLKKTLQPAGLFAATAFVLLNLFFVFSNVTDENGNDWLATVFPSDGWKAGAALVVAFVLAYILLSLNTAILKLLTGELWDDAYVLAPVLRAWQRHRRSALRSQVRSYERKSRTLAGHIRYSGQYSLARLTLSTSFPATLRADTARRRIPPPSPSADQNADVTLDLRPEEQSIAPTALGNVMNAISSYIWQHYCIDMTALWPHMETVVGDQENSALATRLGSAKATLDFLVNLAFVLVLFAIEYALLQLFVLQQWPEVLIWTLVFVLVAYLIYRAAVGAARTWGDAVQMAFDLHRDDLRQKLGLRAFTDQADERQAWERFSHWLLWGGNPPDDIFVGEPVATPPTPSITCSANATVTLQSRTAVGQEIDYVLFVSPAATPQTAHAYYGPAKDIYILVADPLVSLPSANGARAPQAATRQGPRITLVDDDWTGGESATPTAIVLPPDRSSSCTTILWHIRELPFNGARALHYRLSSDQATATPVATPSATLVAATPESPVAAREGSA